MFLFALIACAPTENSFPEEYATAYCMADECTDAPSEECIKTMTEHVLSYVESCGSAWEAELAQACLDDLAIAECGSGDPDACTVVKARCQDG